jgi:hypothetical protein
MEHWKTVEGYESQYQVSNYGRVRSLPRKIKSSYEASRQIPGRVLKPRNNGYGYLHVCFSNKGTTKHKYIHRLVAGNFVPNPHQYLEVNHLDGDKTNNVRENLAWVSRSLNETHAWKLGLKTSSQYAKKLTVGHIKAIKILYNSKQFTQKELGVLFRVHKETIHRILRGKIWRQYK